MPNYLPPGPLAAYLGVRDANANAGLAEVQKAVGVQGLLSKIAEQRQLEQTRNVLAQPIDHEQKVKMLMNINPKLAESYIGSLTSARNYENINAFRAGTEALGEQPEINSLVNLAAKHSDPKDVIGLLKAKNASTGSPYFTNVPTSTGNYILDARTGSYRPMMGSDGTVLLTPTIDPKAQGAVAYSKNYEGTTGENLAKRHFNMSGIGNVIQEARDILGGVTTEGGVTKQAPKPTGSGLGAAYDYAAGMLGYSPEGAIQAQRLKAIGGALTAKMPRMEGPQSDRDTQLYREMAAQIGDPSIPIDRRLAALKTVEDLWAKYEKSPSNSPIPQGKPERRVLRTGTHRGRKVTQYTDGSIEYAD